MQLEVIHPIYANTQCHINLNNAIALQVRRLEGDRVQNFRGTATINHAARKPSTHQSIWLTSKHLFPYVLQTNEQVVYATI